MNVFFQNKQSESYVIQFITCSSTINENERKSVMRKHREKFHYDTMEPAAKKRFLEERKMRNSEMDMKRKKKLNDTMTLTYNTI